MSFTNYIANKLIDYNSESSIAFKMRKKRAERIKSLIKKCYNKNECVNIIDIGGTSTYWKIIPNEFLLEKNVHITIVNLPSPDTIPKNDNIFTFAEGDGCALTNFSEDSFHIAHSNSVIEHVGNWGNIENFSKEIKRVAENFYLQTPNYWFPIEPHFMTPFFHWFPKTFRIKLVMWFKLGWYNKAKNYNEAQGIVETVNLLSKKDLLRLFPEAKYYYEKVGFLVKSFILISK